MNRQEDILSFLNGPNAAFIQGLFEQYQSAPQTVSSDWQAFFESLVEWPPQPQTPPPNGHTKAPSGPQSAPLVQPPSEPAPQPPISATALQENSAIQDSIRALMMIRAYRVRGHLIADLDPLGMDRLESHPELDPTTYGFALADYDRSIFLNGTLGLQFASLKKILDILYATYCGKIGVEFMHIQEPDQKAWLQRHIEGGPEVRRILPKDQKAIWRDLLQADTLERFLNTKYPGAKRFGLEGGESTISAIESILSRCASYDTQEVVLGMAHRGRLSILTNILHKPTHLIFSEFQGNAIMPDTVQGSGDVKYHMGFSTDRMIQSKDGESKKIHLSLTPNPSHLEAVNPVVLGKTRAKQDILKDFNHEKAISILLHGDAAFAGQGLVAETLDLSALRGYRTGGTIHIITNNQIGFTTSPPHSRSSPYCSDVAKGNQVPILHVNGDDPDAVVFAARLAADFRQQFKQDVVLDIVCYRRHGHNEIDEPLFTQPLMYKKIKSHPPVEQGYRQALIDQGTFSSEEAEAIENRVLDRLRKEFTASTSHKNRKADWLEGTWTGIKSRDFKKDHTEDQPITGIHKEDLKKIAKTIMRAPQGFNLHPKLEKQFNKKHKLLEEGHPIDWATGEALAFGSLLLDGKPVRLSGQDCRRGTFSQRHAAFVDQITEENYIPLNNIQKGQERLEVIDSPLAEASVLGFEYGYTQANPHALVLWEAQFGDFSNGAQVIIDQFIASGEAKWLRLSGLVLLLPHGFEGQGPEHSSARLERFLQLCAEDNIQVANCSTPASYFHILRRQVCREIRKPLVIMTPKSLLRHPLALSSLKDMEEGTRFQLVIPDEGAKPKAVKRVVLCSGKVYYDLYQQREELKKKDIAIVRIEQLYPFPHQQLVDTLKPLKAAEIIWCQEEPLNMGAWTFLDRRLEAVLSQIKATQKRSFYVGRAAAASPATGHAQKHTQEQKELVQAALTAKSFTTNPIVVIS